MTITAGLWASPAPSALVNSSFPFNKSIYVYSRIWYGVLIMEVKTGYESAARNMDVVINGVKIGEIFPRPWSGGSNLEQISFIFGLGMLNNNVGQPVFYSSKR
jgi:hypothetical protein